MVTEIPLYIDLHPALLLRNVVKVLRRVYRLVEVNYECRKDMPFGLAQPVGRIV